MLILIFTNEWMELLPVEMGFFHGVARKALGTHTWEGEVQCKVY